LGVGPAAAGIINVSDVTAGGNTYHAFRDTTTAKTWLEFNSFWNSTNTYNSIVSLLTGSGFHLATLPELQALQASVGADPAAFLNDAQIMGGNYAGRPDAPNGVAFGMILGIYEDGNASNGLPISWRTETDTAWNFYPNLVPSDVTLQSYGSNLGAWVVSDSASAAIPNPEPSSLALLGLGAVSLIGYARRQRRKAATPALA